MSEKKSAFHVIGLPEADLLEAKSTLLMAIKTRLADRGVTNQGEAAALLGMAPSEVSHLLRGVLNRFTFDRIAKALKKLDANAHVRVVVEWDEPEVAVR